jgi:hypothetical protein
MDDDVVEASDFVATHPVVSVAAEIRCGHCYVHKTGLTALASCIRSNAAVLHVYLGEEGFLMKDPGALEELVDALQANRDMFFRFARLNGASEQDLKCFGKDSGAIQIRRHGDGDSTILQMVDNVCFRFHYWTFPTTILKLLRSWFRGCRGLTSVVCVQRALKLNENAVDLIGSARSRLHGKHVIPLPDDVVVSILEFIMPVTVTGSSSHGRSHWTINLKDGH